MQVDHAIRDNDEVQHLRARARRPVDAEDADDRGIVLGGHRGGGTVPDAEELAAEVEQFLREQDDGS